MKVFNEGRELGRLDSHSLYGGDWVMADRKHILLET